MADPITLMLISAGASAVAGGVGAAGTIAQGNAQYAAAKSEREQLNRMASEELAVATRGMSEKARETRLLQSRGQAVAASSGGKATDSTVLEIMGNIAKESNVQQRDILRTGQVKADDLMYRGSTGVRVAKANRGISRLMAGAQIASAASDAFAKYGQGMEMKAAQKTPLQNTSWTMG